MLPTISDPQDVTSKSLGGLTVLGGSDGVAMAVKTLSRSTSQPVVFPPNKLLEKRLKQLTKGAGVFTPGSNSQKHEDDLDILKQIIETDVAMATVLCEDGRGGGGGCGMDEEMRSQSLTHIPGQFSYAGSLPSLHHAESMHILHANYNSAPDFMQFGKSRLISFDASHTSLSSHPRGAGAGEFGAEGYQGSFSGGGQEKMGGMRTPAESRRRSSLYESHSAVTTPVLANDSAQSTPQSPPFEFAPHRNVPLPAGFSSSGTEGGGYTPGPTSALNKWNTQSNGSNIGTPNTYQYAPVTSTEGAVDHSSSCTMAAETGILGRQERAVLESMEGGKVENPSSTSVLCDYLEGGNPGGIVEDKSKSNMLPRSLKGTMVPIHIYKGFYVKSVPVYRILPM